MRSTAYLMCLDSCEFNSNRPFALHSRRAEFCGGRSVYQAASGAWVFAAGSIEWSWGLNNISNGGVANGSQCRDATDHAQCFKSIHQRRPRGYANPGTNGDTDAGTNGDTDAGTNCDADPWGRADRSRCAASLRAAPPRLAAR